MDGALLGPMTHQEVFRPIPGVNESASPKNQNIKDVRSREDTGELRRHAEVVLE